MNGESYRFRESVKTHAGANANANDLSRRTNIKPAAISAFRNDKWKGSPGTLYTTASQLARAVNALLLQRKADETRIDGFVKTRVAEAIYALVRYTIKRRMIGAFVVPAGSGKTMALQQLAEEIPGAVMLTVTRTRSSPKSFLQLWARSLGPAGRGHPRHDHHAIGPVGAARLDRRGSQAAGCLPRSYSRDF